MKRTNKYRRAPRRVTELQTYPLNLIGEMRDVLGQVRGTTEMLAALRHEIKAEAHPKITAEHCMQALETLMRTMALYAKLTGRKVYLHTHGDYGGRIPSLKLEFTPPAPLMVQVRDASTGFEGHGGTDMQHAKAEPKD